MTRGERNATVAGRTDLLCRRCGHRNPSIDIWCGRCGANLDWHGEKVASSSAARATAPRQASPRRPSTPRPALHWTWPTSFAHAAALAKTNAGLLAHFVNARFYELRRAVEARREAARRSQTPSPVQRLQSISSATASRLREGSARWSPAAPAAARTVFCPNCGRSNSADTLYCPRCGKSMSTGLEALADLSRRKGSKTPAVLLAILGLLVLGSLAFAFAPPAVRGKVTSKTSAAPSAAHSTRPSAPAATPSTLVRAALPAVEKTSGLTYAAAGCSAGHSCLTGAREIEGQDAALVTFNAGADKSCAAYLIQTSGGWQVTRSVCAGTSQLSPVPGQPATVRVGSVCARTHASAALAGRQLACLANGARVNVDGAPVYADNFIWWHTNKGWIAQTFLRAP